MNKNILKIGITALSFGTPLLTFAAGKNLSDIMIIITRYFESFGIFIIGLAIVTFIFNVYRYFFLETEKRKEAGLYVLYSVIGFFVILSIWGLVALLTNSFQLDNNKPNWPFSSGGSRQTGPVSQPGTQGQNPIAQPGTQGQNNPPSGNLPNPWDH